ncbi:MAG: hypothetical protein WCO94_15320, partial [Verrucomicrobiota bacterium]
MHPNEPDPRFSASIAVSVPQSADRAHVVTRFSRSVSFSNPSLGRSGGFTLVEVAMALGLFAFAIIPIIGMMGTGLCVSKDSIESSTLAQIFRQAEAYAA